MSHYNYKDYVKYIRLAEEARRDGQSEEVVKQLEERAAYFWGLLGGHSKGGTVGGKLIYRKRKAKQAKDDGVGGELTYDFSEEWNQAPLEDDNM